MNEPSKIGRLRGLVYLLPAALTVTLIFVMLARTQPVLAELPERLARLTSEAIEAVTEPQDEPAMQEPEEPEPEELLAGEYEDGVYTGSSQGYGGLVTVQVTVESGHITQIEILSAPGETEPYFTLAQTILDSVLSQQSWEVDGVSGATYSSRGILGAIQNAITGQTVENASPVKTTVAGTTVQDSFTEPAAYEDGVYYGSAEGFGGTIQVEVTIRSGQIETIRIISAAYETSSYLRQAQSVVSSILSAGSPNVDAVSGATYSSTGIINAVKRALNQAANAEEDGEVGSGSEEPDVDLDVSGSDEPDGDDLGSGEPDVGSPDGETPEPDDSGSDEPAPEEPEEGVYSDGTYTASGWCEDEDGTFRYEITVTVEVSQGNIVAVDVEKTQEESEEPEDNDSFLAYAIEGRTRRGVFYVGVPQQILNKQNAEEIDAVSGATYSSRTIQTVFQEAMADVGEEQTPPEEGNEPQTPEADASGEPSAEPEESTDTEEETALPDRGEPSEEPAEEAADKTDDETE